MRKFGLKMWSRDFIKNPEFVLSAEKALKDGLFGYLELFALPDSFKEVKNDALKAFKGVKTVIHAPHAVQELNPSFSDMLASNLHKLSDSQRFADLLNASIIILHPGFRVGEHAMEENIRQFQIFNEPRLAVENLPYLCSSTHQPLVSVSPKEIKRIIKEAGCQFCLDFSHAICGANHFQRDVYEVLSEFKELHPVIYHLCDGDISSVDDAHLHYGEGNYDLKRLVLDYTEENAIITMETGHDIPSSVEPWINDLAYIRKLCSA